MFMAAEEVLHTARAHDGGQRTGWVDVQRGTAKLNGAILLLMARGHGQDKSNKDDEVGECLHCGSLLNTVDRFLRMK